MNNHNKTHLERWIWRIAMVVVILNWLISSSCTRQEESLPEKKLPAPKTLSSTLEMPKPVEFQEIEGRASLPDQLKLGFALDLDGRAIPGDWNVKGKTTTIEGRTVSFTSDEGKTGHLVYRLPEGLRLSLASDQPISIQRTLRGYQVSLGYELLVSSSERLVVASGRLLGGSPQETKIQDGLSLKQGQERGQMISESKYENIYQIPVTLTADRKTTEPAIGEITEVALQDKPYSVLVFQSTELIPNKEYEGVAEGQGYTLEYAVTPK